jgi:actin-related protein
VVVQEEGKTHANHSKTALTNGMGRTGGPGGRVSETFGCAKEEAEKRCDEIRQCRGIHEQVFNAIMVCDFNICKKLVWNVVRWGGTTMFPGWQIIYKRNWSV